MPFAVLVLIVGKYANVKILIVCTHEVYTVSGFIRKY